MSIAEQLQNGDCTAFDEVFHKYYSKLCSFIYSFVGDMDEAKDIAQRTFIIFWEKRENIKDKNSLQPYLYMIAKNLTMDYFKSVKVKNRYFEQVKSENANIDFELNEHSLELYDAEKANIERLKKKIRNALASLPLGDRNIFILKRFDNLTINEIAQILNISPKTVEKRITITIKVLRKKLFIYIIFIV